MQRVCSKGGDEVWANGDRRLRVEGLRAIEERATVYNLEIEGSHTYFVGEGGAWVHNACGDAAEGGAAAARTQFQVAERVAGQLADSRLGPLAGKISPEGLQGLANNPNALKFLDTASGHTNTVQLVDGRLLRITTAATDPTRIISVGPMQQRGLFNGILNGRFEPIIP